MPVLARLAVEIHLIISGNCRDSSLYDMWYRKQEQNVTLYGDPHVYPKRR